MQLKTNGAANLLQTVLFLQQKVPKFACAGIPFNHNPAANHRRR